MKKFLWLLMLMPIFMVQVLANEVYYSEYGDFSEYQEQEVVENDMVDVEKITMYKWYKEIQVPTEFQVYDSAFDFTDNCYESDFTEWSENIPSSSEARAIEEMTMYNYSLSKPVRVINLNNLIGSNGYFKATEIQVFYDNKEIPFQYFCLGNNCSSDFFSNISNGIYEEQPVYIKNGTSVVIDLQRDYPIHRIKLVMYVYDEGDTNISYDVAYSQANSDYFLVNKYDYNYTSKNLSDLKKVEYAMTNLDGANSYLFTSVISNQIFDNEYIYDRISFKKYRYKEKFCQRYAVKSDFYPEYTIESVGDYNKKASSKDFYRYRSRDKLELNIFDITQKDFDLNNFVVYNSSNYSIEDNIDWAKNGTYQIRYQLGSIDVTKDVNLNILDNSLEKTNEQLADLKKQLENIKNDYDKITNDLEKTNQNYLEELTSLNNLILQLEDKIQNLKEDSLDNRQFMENIQEEIELKLNLTCEKISNLEKINEMYLQVLSDKIEQLEGILSNKDLEIEDLIKDYISKYELKVKDLEDFNNESVIKLEQINSNIEKINHELLKLDIDNADRYNDLNNKVIDNKNSLDKLQSIISNYIEDFKNLGLEIQKIKDKVDSLEQLNISKYNELIKGLENNNKSVVSINKIIDNIKGEITNLNNNQIDSDKFFEQLKNINSKLELYKNESNNNNYEQIILGLQELNNKYTTELDILKQEFKCLEKQIVNMDTKTSSNYGKINDFYKLIYESITENKTIIEELKQNQVNDMEDIKKLKDSFEFNTEKNTEQQVDLNSKLNDYFLKINGVEIVNLLWFYILLVIIFCIYLIYLFKKKSNKKNF